MLVFPQLRSVLYMAFFPNATSTSEPVPAHIENLLLPSYTSYRLNPNIWARLEWAVIILLCLSEGCHGDA